MEVIASLYTVVRAKREWVCELEVAAGMGQLPGSAQGQDGEWGWVAEPALLPANEEAVEHQGLMETGNTRVTMTIVHLQLNCKIILRVNTHVKNNKVINCREKAEFYIPNCIFDRSLCISFYFIVCDAVNLTTGLK